MATTIKTLNVIMMQSVLIENSLLGRLMEQRTKKPRCGQRAPMGPVHCCPLSAWPISNIANLCRVQHLHLSAGFAQFKMPILLAYITRPDLCGAKQATQLFFLLSLGPLSSLLSGHLRLLLLLLLHPRVLPVRPPSCSRFISTL